MTHYIDKDALVAEIEKVADEPAPSHDQQCPWEDGYYCGLYKVMTILDILEVKEVNLDDKIYDYINAHYSEGCDGGMISDAHNNIGGVTYLDLTTIAKHFFELGMAASNKAQKGE